MAVNHVPPDHAEHDELRIAACAAGDLDGTELTSATELIESCAVCARLADDLGLIRSATHELPGPQRTRDFRLTESDAARLRPRGWRRFLVSFAEPRFSFVQPLATGLATLGLVGILLAALPAGIGGLGGFSASSEVTTVGGAQETSGDRAAAPEVQPSDAAAPAGQAPAGPALTAPTAPEPSASSGAAVLAPSSAVPSEAPVAVPDAGAAEPPAATPGAGAATAPGGGAAAQAAPEAGLPTVNQKDLAVGPTRDGSADAGPTTLLVLSLALLLGGVVLFALRFAARRIAAS